MRRLRVWDYVLSANEAPDREIVHSHDFNRYLTPFRAEWDPKDSAERTFVVGRYCTLSPTHQRTRLAALPAASRCCSKYMQSICFSSNGLSSPVHHSRLLSQGLAAVQAVDKVDLKHSNSMGRLLAPVPASGRE